MRITAYPVPQLSGLDLRTPSQAPSTVMFWWYGSSIGWGAPCPIWLRSSIVCGKPVSAFARFKSKSIRQAPAGDSICISLPRSPEFEREMISERTKAGMASAKRRGKHVGRPRKLTAQQIDDARELQKSETRTRAAVAETVGVDVATLRRALGAAHQKNEACKEPRLRRDAAFGGAGFPAHPQERM